MIPSSWGAGDRVSCRLHEWTSSTMSVTGSPFSPPHLTKNRGPKEARHIHTGTHMTELWGVKHRTEFFLSVSAQACTSYDPMFIHRRCDGCYFPTLNFLEVHHCILLSVASLGPCTMSEAQGDVLEDQIMQRMRECVDGAHQQESHWEQTGEHPELPVSVLRVSTSREAHFSSVFPKEGDIDIWMR